MKKIFIVCYGGGHVRIIKNVYDELIKNKELNINILALTEAQKYLTHFNISYQTIEKYHEIIKDKEAERIGKDIIKELNLNFNDKESILYYGYSFKELVEKYGKGKALEGYLKFGRRAFLPLNFMEKILKYENPDLIIITNSPRMEKSALICSKKLKIDSISIEDLFGEESEINFEMEKYFNSNYYRAQYGDYVCVISEETRKALEKKTDSKIVVTGNPNFDELVKIKDKIQKLHIDRNYYIITFLSQPYKNQNEYIKKILEILEKNKNYFLIFKFHPTENIENYTSIFDEYKELKNRYLLLQNKLYESINTANLVITRTSTASIEADILGKKIIGEKNIYVPFKKLKIGLEFSNINEIEKIIAITKNKNSLKEESFYINELASVNIKKLVLKVLNNK